MDPSGVWEYQLSHYPDISRSLFLLPLYFRDVKLVHNPEEFLLCSAGASITVSHSNPFLSYEQLYVPIMAYKIWQNLLAC
jgi:hypothetical protein